jgi:nucleoside-diphosphate-sugar epimerase
MFGRGLTRLQPAYVKDVAEAIGRVMQRAETRSTIFEFGALASTLTRSFSEPLRTKLALHPY